MIEGFGFGAGTTETLPRGRGLARRVARLPREEAFAVLRDLEGFRCEATWVCVNGGRGGGLAIRA